MTDDQKFRTVRRRRVFYIPGYDPFPARRYRELYRTEGEAQAQISGYDIALRAVPQADGFAWAVNSLIDGAETEAQVEVLVWSDIVRGSIPKSIAATYWQLLRTSWLYISTGTLRRLMWMRKGPVIAALYPVFALLGQLLAGVLGGWITGRVITGLLNVPLSFIGLSVPAALQTLIVGAAIIGITAYALRWFHANDGRFYAYYLMHDYAYSASHKGANPPALEARMGEFADRIAAALTDTVDEVLVVGHSSGAHMGVSILADLIRSRRVPADGPALGFLSLGQVVPMVSFLPKAGRLRKDLAFLSARPELTWIDVTAPGDGCAFALCDPVSVSGVAPPDQKWPLVISAAFTQTLSPERWAELRRRFFRLHFQYLCAFDRPGDYDYFQITAGPKTLAARFAGRAPSRSRIDVVASKYTSTAA